MFCKLKNIKEQKPKHLKRQISVLFGFRAHLENEARGAKQLVRQGLGGKRQCMFAARGSGWQAHWRTLFCGTRSKPENHYFLSFFSTLQMQW